MEVKNIGQCQITFQLLWKITITHPKIAPISVCLTSDLDNYIIDNMDTNEAQECFSDNVLMKIPHHGSKHSSNIVNYIKSLHHAATTTYKPSNLPLQEVLDEYKRKKSIVSSTGVNSGHYGIIKYDIELKKQAVNNVQVEYYGAANSIN